MSGLNAPCRRLATSARASCPAPACRLTVVVHDVGAVTTASSTDHGEQHGPRSATPGDRPGGRGVHAAQDGHAGDERGDQQADHRLAEPVPHGRPHHRRREPAAGATRLSGPLASSGSGGTTSSSLPSCVGRSTRRRPPLTTRRRAPRIWHRRCAWARTETPAAPMNVTRSTSTVSVATPRRRVCVVRHASSSGAVYVSTSPATSTTAWSGRADGSAVTDSSRTRSGAGSRPGS